MQINEKLYKNLELAARIKTALAAAARDDSAEISRLVATCPKKTYTATDAAFTDTIQTLLGLSLCIECDKRSYALGFLFAMRHSEIDAARLYLSKLGSTQAAWEKFLTQCGISITDMQKAGAPRDNILELIEQASCYDAEMTEQYYQALWENFPHKGIFVKT